jgi:polar amino acid transport system substrate-binding protein
MIAATENGYPPLNFVDPKTGQGAGWEYDVMNEAAKRLNAKIDWKVAAWKFLLQSVQDGQFDIAMDGIVITSARLKVMDFSFNYLTSPEYALVRADSKLTDSPDLKGSNTLVYGTQTGSANYDTAVELVGGDAGLSRIKSFDVFNSAIEALKTNDVDVVPTYREAAQKLIEQNPGVFKVLPTALRSDRLGFALAKGSKLTSALDAALAQMKADGTLTALNQKWHVGE